QVTRDRMYTDAMQQIYANTTKVLVDSKQGSNLLYLPLDKLMQMTGQQGGPAQVEGALPSAPAAAPAQSSSVPVTPSSSARDARSRER
ncbi:MAG: protease modulator HflK, partial [Comamonadaceae bacterium]